MTRLLLCLMLTGCSAFEPQQTYKIERKTVKITVVEVNGLPTMGRAGWSKDTCFIALREYPKCLQHEMRHCLEGQWHGSAPNGSDCL